MQQIIEKLLAEAKNDLIVNELRESFIQRQRLTGGTRMVDQQLGQIQSTIKITKSWVEFLEEKLCDISSSDSAK